MTMDSKVSQKKFAWEDPPLHDPYLHWRVRRSTLYAFIGSLVVHLLVLFVVPQQRVGSGDPSETNRNSLVVNLRPSASSQSAPSSPAVVPETQPAPAARRPKASAAPVIALNKPSDSKLSRPVEPVMPAVPPSPAPAAPTDMQSFVDAARARRRAAEGQSGRDQPAAGPPSAEREPSEDEIRMANVKRNLAVGTSGIFQIISIESRRASFSFRGWTSDSSNSRREFIQVEIGTNSSIEIAIVRRMIDLIRKYYKGDFNWESQRLDRVVTLSARVEDNEGLEAFMMKEFFAEPPRRNSFR
jgi:hypothetical protein